MINDILKELEGALQAGKKAEALAALTRLRKELGALQEAQGEVRSQLEEFEISHPDLVKAVDAVSRLLSQIGI